MDTNIAFFGSRETFLNQRPLALRPHIATGLPLSEIYKNLHKTIDFATFPIKKADRYYRSALNSTFSVGTSQ